MGRYLARSCSSEQVRSVEGKSNADLTIIKIRQFRNGWKCFEAPGVEPVFLSQEQAIGYAETRVCYRSGDSCPRLRRKRRAHDRVQSGSSNALKRYRE